jgi:hypothetical protein
MVSRSEICLSIERYDELSRSEVNSIVEIAEKSYGDPNWIFYPKDSDFVLKGCLNEEIIGFCLFDVYNSYSPLKEITYREVLEKQNLDTPVTVLHHIIVENQFQSQGVGKTLIEEINEFSKTVVCKAWNPSDKEKTFFDSVNYKRVTTLKQPWSDSEFYCNGCSKNSNCECSGIAYCK